MAIAPVISPEASLAQYRALVDHVARKLDRQPMVLQRQTYAEVNDLVRFGQCEMALVCTYSYVVGERDFGMKLLATPVIDGQTSYRSTVIVPRDSSARNLLDLEGRSFAHADLMSTSGYISPRLWLMGQERDPERFFGEEIRSGSHDRSISAVASGLADGAAVDSLVLDRMIALDGSLAGRVRAIQQSEPYAMPPIVVPARIDPVLADRILEVLVGMDEDEQGVLILRALGFDAFTPASRDSYDSVRAAALAWETR